MLADCNKALIVVEGFKDYILLAGLLGDIYDDITFAGKERETYYKLRLCGSRCLVVYALNGIKNLKDYAVRRLAYKLKTFTTSGCFIVILDSDDNEPQQRVSETEEKLGKILDEMYSRVSEDAVESSRYLVAECFEPRRGRGPRLCLSSWRCSGDCWLALASRSCRITNLEECNRQLRMVCKDCIKRFGEGELVGLVRGALANANTAPWA